MSFNQVAIIFATIVFLFLTITYYVLCYLYLKKTEECENSIENCGIMETCDDLDIMYDLTVIGIFQILTYIIIFYNRKNHYTNSVFAYVIIFFFGYFVVNVIIDCVEINKIKTVDEKYNYTLQNKIEYCIKSLFQNCFDIPEICRNFPQCINTSNICDYLN